jgi:hypothetical protein
MHPDIQELAETVMDRGFETLANGHPLEIAEQAMRELADYWGRQDLAESIISRGIVRPAKITANR